VSRRVLAAFGAAALAAVLAAAPITAQQDLPRALDSLAELWARGDATAIAGLGIKSGIDLEVHGQSLGRVSGRKAAAALRQVFANQETMAVRPSMSSRVRGTDDTAFAELTWEVRPRGSAVPARTTVFLGLVRENRDWQVSQIRVMR
jgi:hypothetical protein